MEVQRDQVCVLIPTLNEAPTIGPLIRSFRENGYQNVLVIDGQSADSTPDIARAEGAEVRIQTTRGKGNAVIEALQTIKRPYVLMTDGDGTYSAEDADAMVRPLFAGYDHVIGVRTGPRSFSRLNAIGNWMINVLFKFAHGRYLSDILSGYRSFTLASIRELQLREEGFGIESEMAAQAMKNNQKIAVIPVRYGIRTGTATKLSPFSDGFRIVRTIYRMARQNNPLFYFGLIGVVVMAGGFGTGVYVVLEWLNGIEHLPLTLLTLLLVTLGFEILMFGMMGDIMLAFHREVLFEIQQGRRPPS